VKLQHKRPIEGSEITDHFMNYFSFNVADYYLSGGQEKKTAEPVPALLHNFTCMQTKCLSTPPIKLLEELHYQQLTTGHLWAYLFRNGPP